MITFIDQVGRYMMKHTVYESRNSNRPIKHIDEKSISEEVVELMKENALIALYEEDDNIVAEDVFGNVYFNVIKHENRKG